MKFSIIMQSLIANYPNSARDKEKKILRAVNSVLNQTFQDFELLIISDNCSKTVQIINENYDLSEQLRLFLYESKTQKGGWSSECRNVGIEKSLGDYILYLDIDDYYKQDYLENLDTWITKHNLYFVDDIVFNKDAEITRRCNLKRFMCGTSNVIHKKCSSRWSSVSRYAHEDYDFIQCLLKEFKDYKQLQIAGYVVGHIPAKYDK